MNRIFKALGAFALTLVLALTLAAAPLCTAAEAPESDVPYAGYLVMLAQDRPAPQAEEADLFARATLLAAESERAELIPLAERTGIYKTDDLERIQNLVWSGQVTLVEPDYQAELFELDLTNPADPNDDYFRNRYQFNLTDVNVQSAWDAGLTGEGVTVAVIDSGINLDHVDAPAKIAAGRYFFYRQEDDGQYEFNINGVIKKFNYYSTDYVVDNLGHGSMVSGIVAANTNNATARYTGGVAGMAPNATILPIRCFTATQNHLGGYTSNLISGVNYAAEHGADIINMSWGIRNDSASLRATVTAAANAGCIMIAAVGNDGTTSLQYPAAYPNVIGVGSTDKLGRLSDFSQRNSSVNICAPGGIKGGQQIYSLWYTSTNAIGKGDGTSFSAPVVAGAAALLKERDPAMTQADFMALLRDNSDPVSTSSVGEQEYVGYGRLNLKKILSSVGHTGAMLRYGEDGSVTVRAAHFPVGASASGQDAVILLGAYNRAGHLLASQTALSGLGVGYGAYSQCVTFREIPDAVKLKAFFLKKSDLTALTAPVEVSLTR